MSTGAWVRGTVLSCWILAALAMPVGSSAARAAADDAKASSAQAKEQTIHGRLPAYYGDVVDDGQRQAIYKIQEEYAAKLAALKAQLAELLKERNAKIAGALTPEQRQRIEQLQSEATAKRLEAKQKAAASDAAEGAPAAKTKAAP